MGIIRSFLLGREHGLRARARARLRGVLGTRSQEPGESAESAPVEPAPVPVTGAPEGFLAAVRLVELVSGELREVMVAGRPVALALVGETVYAMEGACPHAGGPLAEGILDGTTLTCPMHGWSFDIVTGACHVNPEDRIGILRVQVVEGVVYVAGVVAG